MFVCAHIALRVTVRPHKLILPPSIPNVPLSHPSSPPRNMDELLEVVSEAVSAMVLYTVEADERNTRVVDI